jgi:hypothetical protein
LDQGRDATCKKAGISGLHFHDIRGTTVTMFAEAGCTVPEIASITGHSLRTAQRILDKYLAKTSKLAANAIAWKRILQTVLQTGRALQNVSSGAPEEIRTPDPQIRRQRVQRRLGRL